ncbi:hypothetical protein [Streptomyces orinoci]|uniref:Uncharacterized protein n=1 Tax=Streptomyces orinoci TaxID=67339 RepID=A0ABV3JXW9_STRON|nr:hypothetical protein [Streptomyces orinoci]
MFVLRLLLRRARGAARPPRRPHAAAPAVPAPAEDELFADRVRSELSDELPDEDLGQDLGDCLDQYHLGSKPRCEEVEYLELVQEAIDRIERGH